MKAGAALALLLGMIGCAHQPSVEAPGPSYVIGQGYEARGVWHYPREDFGYDRTGLASVYGDDAPDLTTDGEAYDPNAMAGASQILQLPVIVQVTNLQTGRQLLLRLNDRGPEDPGRIIAVTPKAARLLGIPEDGAAEVRVTVQQGSDPHRREDRPKQGDPLVDASAAQELVGGPSAQLQRIDG